MLSLFFLKDTFQMANKNKWGHTIRSNVHTTKNKK